MKKILMFFMAALLVFGFSLSLSYAFLTDSEGPITNVFTASSGVDILLREETWDGYAFTDPDDNPDTQEIDGWNHGLSTNPAYTGEADLGFDLAHAYLPGDLIPKDPTIAKTAASADCYVALELIYSVDGVEMARTDFEAYLATPIVYDTTNWTDNSDTTLPFDDQLGDFFVYNSALTDSADTTTALFTQMQVGFNSTVGTAILPDADGYYPDLRIDVKAYAIQMANVDDPTAELISFADYGAENP